MDFSCILIILTLFNSPHLQSKVFSSCFLCISYKCDENSATFPQALLENSNAYIHVQPWVSLPSAEFTVNPGSVAPFHCCSPLCTPSAPAFSFIHYFWIAWGYSISVCRSTIQRGLKPHPCIRSSDLAAVGNVIPFLTLEIWMSAVF